MNEAVKISIFDNYITIKSYSNQIFQVTDIEINKSNVSKIIDEFDKIEPNASLLLS